MGSAICEALAADGLEVFIHANSSMEAAQALAQKIIASGGAARALQFDVTDADATRSVLEALAEEKAFQVIVNCAGIHDDAVFAGMRMTVALPSSKLRPTASTVNSYTMLFSSPMI